MKSVQVNLHTSFKIIILEIMYLASYVGNRIKRNIKQQTWTTLTPLNKENWACSWSVLSFNKDVNQAHNRHIHQGIDCPIEPKDKAVNTNQRTLSGNKRFLTHLPIPMKFRARLFANDLFIAFLYDSSHSQLLICGHLFCWKTKLSINWERG